MTGRRVNWTRVAALADRLSERDREIIQALDTVRLLSGAQLERLIFPAHSLSARAHARRRVLNRLVRLEIITTLERRIGGVRAGSNGLVYCLNRFGQRLADFLNGSTPETRTRTPRTPGTMYLSHTLAVTEAFVSLAEWSRAGSASLRAFSAEADCRWADGNGGLLRPDALVIVENDTHEAATWLEIDQGSEDLARIRCKLMAYERFARSGADGPSGFLPCVLFATKDDQRARDIGREIARQGLQTITCEAVRQPLVATHIFGQLNGSESLANMEAVCNTGGTRNVEGI